jgi:hypothetical protein
MGLITKGILMDILQLKLRLARKVFEILQRFIISAF